MNRHEDYAQIDKLENDIINYKSDDIDKLIKLYKEFNEKYDETNVLPYILRKRYDTKVLNVLEVYEGVESDTENKLYDLMTKDYGFYEKDIVIMVVLDGDINVAISLRAGSNFVYDGEHQVEVIEESIKNILKVIKECRKTYWKVVDSEKLSRIVLNEINGE